MHKGHFVTGSVAGTGAAINVSLGFVPQYVRAINAGAGLAEYEWFNGMTNGHALKRVTAGTLSAITSNGITPYDGTAGGDSAGFTIGADANVNISGQTIHYIAVSADA